MGRKRAVAPSEYVSSEEMLQRLDKTIRDSRTTPTQMLQLQRRRDRVAKQLLAEQSIPGADSPASEFTTAQQNVLDNLKLNPSEREMWEQVFRSENPVTEFLQRVEFMRANGLDVSNVALRTELPNPPQGLKPDV